MESHSGGESRWRWRDVSPRRVIGTLLRGFGLIGLAIGGGNYVLGRWNLELDPPFLAASLVMLAVSVPVLWRVKPARWP